MSSIFDAPATGDVHIGYHWERIDEMGFTEWRETELHVIPAVIYKDHKYYAVTPAFVEWLETPDKPARKQFLDRLFYLQ